MPEYFLNNALVNAQMNPDTAERSFVLYWKTAGRQQYTTGISGGTYSDDWSTVYWNDLSNWLKVLIWLLRLAKKRLQTEQLLTIIIMLFRFQEFGEHI